MGRAGAPRAAIGGRRPAVIGGSDDEQLLLPGVGFSVEPGVYVPGEIGMRTEVNAYVADGRLLVTPRDVQQQLLVV